MPSNVRLRALDPGDAEWIHESCQDGEIIRWTTIPRPYELGHAEQFIADQARDLAAWVIADDTSEERLGVISIHAIDFTTNLADIGYWLAAPARGRGAATAAVGLVVDEIVSSSSGSALSMIDGLTGTVAKTNRASARVLLRAGFVEFDPVIDRTCPDDGTEVPAVTYRFDIKK